MPRIFNGKVPSYQLRKLNSIHSVYRGSIYPPLAQFASDSGYSLSAFWSHQGQVEVSQWRIVVFTESRMLGIPLCWWRGRWPWALFVRNGHLWWTYPRARQQGSTQSRAVKSKGSYLCKSAKDEPCLYKHREPTHLFLTTYSVLCGKADRESNKLTKDNVRRRHNLSGDVFGLEGSPGISSVGYIPGCCTNTEERYSRKNLPKP